MPDPKQKQTGPGEKEIRDYGYGEITETTFGVPETTIFTGPMNGNGASPHFKVPGRGAQG